MGIEPPANFSGNRGVFDSGGAFSGALDDAEPAIDPALSAIIDAWPTLPEAVRTSILEMVERSRAGLC
jgi:hypothetical protein